MNQPLPNFETPKYTVRKEGDRWVATRNGRRSIFPSFARAHDFVNAWQKLDRLRMRMMEDSAEWQPRNGSSH